jgi:hypothetical protein
MSDELKKEASGSGGEATTRAPYAPLGGSCSVKEMSNLLLQGCTVAPVPYGISFYRDGEIALRLDIHEELFLLEWLCVKHGIPMPNPNFQAGGTL